MAWPAQDDRRGRWVLCPNNPFKPLQLAVTDDFGELVPVPSFMPADFFTVLPA
jgi:hypothetical protein